MGQASSAAPTKSVRSLEAINHTRSTTSECILFIFSEAVVGAPTHEELSPDPVATKTLVHLLHRPLFVCLQKSDHTMGVEHEGNDAMLV
jgi:hypothetical protein